MTQPKWYVRMIDYRMSNWPGTDTEGKLNLLIFECESEAEANIVKENAIAREDMNAIHVLHTDNPSPKYNPENFFTQIKTKETSPTWYIEGNMAEGAKRRARVEAERAAKEN